MAHVHFSKKNQGRSCCSSHDNLGDHEHHGHEHHGHEHHKHEHHGHEHHEGGLKHKLMVIVATVFLLLAAIFIEHQFQLPIWFVLIVYLVPYLLIGSDTLKEAAEGLAAGEPFNEHFLMSIATIGALCIGFLPGAETQFPEAVFVMLFFQVGEFFEGYAEGQSRKSIAHLMDIRPDVAHVEEENILLKEGAPTVVHDGSTEKQGNAVSEHVNIKDVAPEQVPVGAVIVIRPGERVPLDGVILSGHSSLNTMALTGEAVARDVYVSDEIISGCVNLTGVLRVRTIKSFGESTVSKIISLVEDAAEHKSESETFITKFARIYTPIVVFAAIVLAILPPIVSQLFHLPVSPYFSTWFYRALMFLVVSCPCALVISVPLTFFGGIGGASRCGILIKGANYMDILSKIGTVVFDKTGTLTHGQFAVEAVHPETIDARQLLHLAAHVEHFSTHPIGAALRNAFPDEATDGCHITDVEEISGQGIRARVNDSLVAVGNTKLMDSVGAQWHDCERTGTIIHVAVDGVYAGHVVVDDQVKEDSARAISSLRQMGVGRMVMLTGDRREVAEKVADELRLSEYHAELLPTDKVELVEHLMKQTTPDATYHHDSYLAFVGDGINDAPVLARADVGIAMGALGSDAAIEAADVVLMDDHPSKIALAIRIARHTLSIARQNVFFAIFVKISVLILAAFGWATLWMAVFADVGVTILAVLNAMRALRFPRHSA